MWDELQTDLSKGDKQIKSGVALLTRTLHARLERCMIRRGGGLLSSDRKHGLSTEPVPVSPYVGSSKNLRDLKVVDQIKDRTARKCVR